MTSRHSSEGGRRGVAPWIIVTAVAVLLLAYLQGGGSVDGHGSTDDERAKQGGSIGDAAQAAPPGPERAGKWGT